MSERCTARGGCAWPDTPHTCTGTTRPCERCRCPVNADVLADAPECPHGWQSLDGMALPDIKALFAGTDPNFSLDVVDTRTTYTES